MDDCVLDVIRIRRKLADLERYKIRLQKIAPKTLDAYAGSEIIVKSAVERNVQLISDVQLDVLVQLYKGMEIRIAGDDESVINNMEQKLGKALSEKVRERRRLRNELIHAYAESDFDEQVFEQAHGLKDIDDFINEVGRLVKENK